MNLHEAMGKIAPAHLARKAIIYLRQSSLQQVKHNQQNQGVRFQAHRGHRL